MIEGVIAEISNHHMGDVGKAYELIRIAKESGADYVKMQAFEAKDVKTGSMPLEFYEQCSMTIDEYSSCVDYGEKIGIPVFFSIFGKKFEMLYLRYPEMIRKIASGQVGTSMYGELLKNYNNPNTIISIKNIDHLNTYYHLIDNMNIMFVTPYNYQTSNLFEIRGFQNKHNVIGFSDHSLRIENCKTAIKKYGCKLIEKHFYLGEEIKWKGQVFRDCIHSATPNNFEILVKHYKENFK